MTPLPLYDLADARARWRNASRLMRSDAWTIGDPLVVLIVSRRSIRRARRALRRAGVPIPPPRLTR